MYQKLTSALKKLHRGQRGMTGLETAIILIAFVTVASVLAYSVLSAGIFSAERGKATVYSGLASASATMEVKGSIIGSTDGSELTFLKIWVGLSIPDESVDMDSVIITYFDDLQVVQLTGDDGVSAGTWGSSIDDASTERGVSNALESDEIHVITIAIPGAATLDAYKWFVTQIAPPTGATLTIKRTMPGSLAGKIDLK
ncbi:MAG: hypothetical protein V3R96_02540 [Dehalococcoidales bacterium]